MRLDNLPTTEETAGEEFHSWERSLRGKCNTNLITARGIDGSFAFRLG